MLCSLSAILIRMTLTSSARVSNSFLKFSCLNGGGQIEHSGYFRQSVNDLRHLPRTPLISSRVSSVSSTTSCKMAQIAAVALRPISLTTICATWKRVNDVGLTRFSAHIFMRLSAISKARRSCFRSLVVIVSFSERNQIAVLFQDELLLFSWSMAGMVGIFVLKYSVLTKPLPYEQSEVPGSFRKVKLTKDAKMW